MTIKIHQALNTTTQYGDFGISAGTTEQSQEVSYTLRRIESFDNKQATGVFSVSISGVPAADEYRMMFTYSGKGNVFDQGEPALLAFLEKQQELAAMQGNDPVVAEPEEATETAAEPEADTSEAAPEAAPEVLSK